MTSKRIPTGTTLYDLAFSYDAVLPIEFTMKSTHKLHQDLLAEEEYSQVMMAELVTFDEKKLNVLEQIRVQKRKVARIHDRRIQPKYFKKRRASMENYPSVEVKRAKIWQMVTKLGRTIYSASCTARSGVSIEKYEC